MITRCFSTGHLIHKVNIELVVSELQDLINQTDHLLSTIPDDKKAPYSQLIKLLTSLKQYHDEIR